jgi:thiamine phosphate synthase YjbQ (UPF0047 family)
MLATVVNWWLDPGASTDLASDLEQQAPHTRSTVILEHSRDAGNDERLHLRHHLLQSALQLVLHARYLP